MIPVLPPVTIWWWVGYTDTTRAKGKQALGAVIVKHQGPEHIVAAELIRRGLAPAGGKPVFGRIALEWGEPPAGYEGRLLNAKEAEALAKAWDPGHGGLAKPEDIKRAFLDDDARDGDPLFKSRAAEASIQACRKCGEHHELDEIRPGQRVSTLIGRTPNLPAGSIGVAVEWSQYSQPLYVRVQFQLTDPDGKERVYRENYTPCELAKLGPVTGGGS